MKYKGKELLEITEPQVFSPPKKMLVINELDDAFKEEYVVAIIDNGTNYRVIVEEGTCKFTCYQACYEIPEDPKPRIATRRELSKWLAQGNGEFIQPHVISSNFSYCPGDEDNTVEGHYQVRKWDDTDWHEPDVQYMGIE